MPCPPPRRRVTGRRRPAPTLTLTLTGTVTSPPPDWPPAKTAVGTCNCGLAASELNCPIASGTPTPAGKSPTRKPAVSAAQKMAPYRPRTQAMPGVTTVLRPELLRRIGGGRMSPDLGHFAVLDVSDLYKVVLIMLARPLGANCSQRDGVVIVCNDVMQVKTCRAPGELGDLAQ